MADTLMGLKYLLGDITSEPCPERLSSHTLRVAPKHGVGVTEYWESVGKSFFRKRDPPLIGFLPFSNHRSK